MRDLINLMEMVGAPRLLTEAPNYHAMFSDFIGVDQKAKALVDKYVTWARGTLKKNDRVVWFLRWVRVELAGRVKHANSDIELAKLNKRLNTTYNRSDMVPVNNLMTNLTHFLSLPVARIQQIVWQRQSPQELLEAFKGIEDDWKNTTDARNVLRYAEGEEPSIVMQFPDGYAWFDLETHSCPREAQAMGHCGNAGGHHGDTILSLRHLVKLVDGESYWYPVLTFILDQNGNLGEMKGRGNDKPVARYHPYIMALLRDDRIRGIKGGGYLPKQNFHLTDLDDATREALLQEKPGLGNAWDLYEKEGMTERVLERVHAGLQEHDLDYEEYEPEQKRFIVASWKDFESFLANMYDNDVETILNIALGETKFQLARSDSVETEFFEAVRELPEFWQHQVIARAGLTRRPGQSLDQLCEIAVRRLIQRQDDWFRLFDDAVFHGLDRVRNEAWDRLAKYIAVGWPYGCQRVYDNLPYGGSVAEVRAFVTEKRPVHLYVEEGDLAALASTNEDDGDDEYVYDLHAMRGGGESPSWENISDDYDITERRREEGLVDQDGNDKWLAGIDRSTESLAGAFLQVLQGNRMSSTIRNPSQQELQLEAAALRRLLTISGIGR